MLIKEKANKTGVQFCLLMVEIIGLEPMASCMSSKRSNQLSYTSVRDIKPRANGIGGGNRARTYDLMHVKHAH